MGVGGKWDPILVQRTWMVSAPDGCAVRLFRILALGLQNVNGSNEQAIGTTEGAKPTFGPV